MFQEELISASQTSGSLVQRPLQSVSSPCVWLHTCCDGFSAFCHEVFIAELTEIWNNPWLPSKLKQKSAAHSFRLCSIQSDARFQISEGRDMNGPIEKWPLQYHFKQKPRDTDCHDCPKAHGISFAQGYIQKTEAVTIATN